MQQKHENTQESGQNDKERGGRVECEVLRIDQTNWINESARSLTDCQIGLSKRRYFLTYFFPCVTSKDFEFSCIKMAKKFPKHQNKAWHVAKKHTTSVRGATLKLYLTESSSRLLIDSIARKW